MSFDLGFAFQLAASATTFFAMWQMGNKSTKGPIYGLVSQVAWAGLIITNGPWGLAPVTIAMTFIHGRNLRKWLREEKA